MPKPIAILRFHPLTRPTYTLRDARGETLAAGEDKEVLKSKYEHAFSIRDRHLELAYMQFQCAKARLIAWIDYETDCMVTEKPHLIWIGGTMQTLYSHVALVSPEDVTRYIGETKKW